MIYRVVQYIQPWEIDDLARQYDQLIKGSYYLSKEDIVLFDVTMNVDIVDWEDSKIPMSYFIGKFKYLEAKIKQYYKTEFDTDGSIAGCTDKRRVCSTKEQDFTIWLDSDIYFSEHLLPLLVEASKSIEDSEFILTPQIIKYWDDSWDCIVNSNFLKEAHNHRDYFDLYSIDNLVQNQSEVSVKRNSSIKFGGGWFNLFKGVISTVGLPDELGAYSQDDTYISYCAPKLSIGQYILTGTIVSEIGKKLLEDKDYIKPLLSVKIKDKQKISEDKFMALVRAFYN